MKDFSKTLITQEFKTPNFTPGTNTCEYIVLHHTGTKENTTQGVINAFTGSRKVSAHYLIDEQGRVYQFGKPTDILWHAGWSSWDGKSDMNRYSIGIELIGPLSDGGFTSIQKESLIRLVRRLQKEYGIAEGDIIRHKDISPMRKWDISDTLWNDNYTSFNAWKKAYFCEKEEGAYRKIAGQSVIKDKKQVQVFLGQLLGQVPDYKQVDEFLALIEIIASRR